MSPLMIILLMLILVIGSAHQIALEKYKVEEGNPSFGKVVEQNSSILNNLNYVAISVGKNERDPSTMRKNHLRQDLQHILSLMVKKIIRQRQIKAAKKTDVRLNRKNFGKTVGSNKIPIGEFPEDNNGAERGAETKRGNGNSKSVIGRNSGSEIREKLTKDLLQISDALMPTIRTISDSGLQDVLNYTEPIKLGIERGNNSEMVQNSRVKRESPKEKATNNTSNWIKNDLGGNVDNFKMHAFIVKDEEIPPCCMPAKPDSNRRYFMCSGAILSSKRAITSASCIHFAEVHERNLEVDLGVLVGDLDTRSYVIKINRYEMHPDYDYDVDSNHHATHNLAILHLACSIVLEDVKVPSLPKGLNNDIAHMCCREACDLITMVVTADNQHSVRVVPAKHLPAPRHDDEDGPAYRQLSESALEAMREINKPTFNNESYTPSRRVRSPLKLAAAPTFFGTGSSRRSSRLQNAERSAESPNIKKRKKAKSKQKSYLRNQHQNKKWKKLLNFDDVLYRRNLPGSPYGSILRSLEKQGVNVEEQLAAVDWAEIEETMGKKLSTSNRDKMDHFAKNVVDETMRRLEIVLGDDDGRSGGNGSSIFESLMPNKSRNKTIENFVHVFTKVVSSLVPPNNGGTSSGTSLEEKDLKDPPPSNQECPPLGTPVFANGTLVGLLAYTCDDLQDWVEWKYVNIAKNLNWIRSRMETDFGKIVICAGRGRPVRRSFPDDPFAIYPEKRQPKQSETEIRGGKVEWKRRETSDDVQRSISSGNLDHARNSEPGTYLRIPKDPWFARNSPLTPQVQQEDERRKIFTNSRNLPQAPSRDDGIFNVNTCYVKPDGSTSCQKRSDFAIR